MPPRLLPNSIGGCCVFCLVQLRNPLSFAVSAPAIGCGNSLEGNITWISTLAAMSHRPYFQGGRLGGSGGRSGWRGGGRGAGRVGVGDQRWWDPAWRAERLRQKAAEMEVMDQNECWGKLEQMKRGGEREMVIRRNFSRDDQQILGMVYQLGLESDNVKAMLSFREKLLAFKMKSEQNS